MIPFYVFAFIAVVASLLVIAQRNPIYSVLLLIASFGALSGLYVLLDAPFVAVIQIIVYAGAIMVLFLFVVMLLNAPHEETEYDEQTHPLLRRGPMRFGASLALALGVELCWALARGGESRAFAPGSVDAVAAIGDDAERAVPAVDGLDRGAGSVLDCERVGVAEADDPVAGRELDVVDRESRAAEAAVAVH